jgi:hypothetical protein
MDRYIVAVTGFCYCPFSCIPEKGNGCDLINRCTPSVRIKREAHEDRGVGGSLLLSAMY